MRGGLRPTLVDAAFFGSEVTHGLTGFKERCNLVVANRWDDKLADVTGRCIRGICSAGTRTLNGRARPLFSAGMRRKPRAEVLLVRIVVTKKPPLGFRADGFPGAFACCGEGLGLDERCRTSRARPNPIEERVRVNGRQGVHSERRHCGHVLHIRAGLGVEKRETAFASSHLALCSSSMLRATFWSADTLPSTMSSTSRTLSEVPPTEAFVLTESR